MWKSLIIATGAILISLSTAFALELTNDDDTTYAIEIIEGEGDSTQRDYELDSDTILEFDCETGCTIQIVNGMQQQFNGDEVVTITNGEFVIVE